MPHDGIKSVYTFLRIVLSFSKVRRGQMAHLDIIGLGNGPNVWTPYLGIL